jgi:UDP-3-O-[3-hydroxymyristoyl] glucosamine N-acyltransferase
VKKMQNDQHTLAELASLIGAELNGDPKSKIYGLASLNKAEPGQISFLYGSRYQLMASSRYQKYLMTTRASAVVLKPQMAALCPVSTLILDNPGQGYVKLAALFAKRPYIVPGIHSTVVMGMNCQIDSSVSIGANCVIGNHVVIGSNTIIGAGCVIADDTHIGTDVCISPNVTIHHQVQLGDRVIIQSGAVIGSDGFGMIRERDSWKMIPQIGGVTIGNDVEIGANTTIDRGSIEDTIIEHGVKLDNQIQVGHNVYIGANTVIAGCVGIAGSVHIGQNCMIGGATGIADNIEIADNVIFTGMSQVTKSITKPGIYSSGTGIMPHRKWQKNIVRLHSLDDIAKKLQNLEKSDNE